MTILLSAGSQITIDRVKIMISLYYAFFYCFEMYLILYIHAVLLFTCVRLSISFYATGSVNSLLLTTDQFKLSNTFLTYLALFCTP